MKLYLRKIDGYIVRKFLTTFIFIVLAVTVIIFVMDLAEKLGDFVEKKLPFSEILSEYYANFLPFMVNKLSPICIFLAVIFFTSKMTTQSEVVAILSGGISFYRLLLPYMVTATVLAAASFYLNAYIVPHATQRWLAFEQRRTDNPYHNATLVNIAKKIDNQSFFFMQSYQKNEYRGNNVSLLERDSTRRIVRRLDVATLNWVDSTRSWKMVGMKEFFFRLDGTHTYRERGEADTTLKLKPEDIFQRENQAETMTLSELEEYIEVERDRGSNFLPQLIRTQQERYAYPFAAIILTVIGVALSTTKRRGGISMQLGLGLVLCFLYILILNTASLIIGDSAPIWVAVWLPNGLFLGLAVFLVRIAPK